MRLVRVGLTILVTLAGSIAWCQGGKDEPRVTFEYQIKGYHRTVSGPKTSPDGKLALRIDGLTVQLYEVDTGKPFGKPLSHPDLPRKEDMVISHWAFSPDGKMLAVGLGDEKYPGTDDTAGLVYVWDVASGTRVATNQSDIGRVTELYFRDNKTLVVYSFEVSGK